jgi:hypothetical protein
VLAAETSQLFSQCRRFFVGHEITSEKAGIVVTNGGEPGVKLRKARQG